MNQRVMVIKYMKDFGSITTLEAFRDLGITHVAGRIKELRDTGIPIITETETSKNRYGKTVRYGRYRFGELNEYHKKLIDVLTR